VSKVRICARALSATTNQIFFAFVGMAIPRVGEFGCHHDRQTIPLFDLAQLHRGGVG
jgi:hypothetical protein